MATTNNFTFGVDTHPFTLDFPFIDEDNLVVTLDGVVKTLNTDYTVINKTNNTAAGVGFLSGARIQFTVVPSSGAVKVVRDTNLEATSTFKTGSAIRAVDLNSNFTQNLYVTEEISNNAILTDGSNAFDGNLNMGGYKIVNLQSSPAADTDAANKLYVDTKVGASGPPGYTNWSYTAIGGETILGTSGPILEYQSGKEQVYLNGALQQRNVDYTADPAGAKITFLVALTAGDNVMVRCVNYLAADPTASYDYSRWTYTATGGETTLSGGSPALSYTASREQVFFNGALLQRGADYTATNGTSISILGSPLISGDIVEVHSNNSI